MPRITIDRIDHLVLTVNNIEVTCEFYGRVLGMQRVELASGRIALAFGQQKINLHSAGNEYDPTAQRPSPGSADICFIAATPISDAVASLQAEKVEVIEGPGPKSGATGPITSIYFRDPDGNLIEVSNYD